MRLKGAKQVHYDSGPNMTPLVDVVMVILIFLMLAGSFGASEHYLASKVPITKNGSGSVTDAVPDETDFTIRVDANEDRFNAVPDGMDAFQDEASLKAALSTKLAQFAAAGTPLDKVQVIIDPGKLVKYPFLIQVYEAALDADGPPGPDGKPLKFSKVAFEQPHD
jgi:biopolymer transport protein ExbD